MYHQDGTEVYLKPAAEENKELKFTEFPVIDPILPFIDSDRDSRCTVRAREGDFDIVIRLGPGFKMYSASALSVEAFTGDKLRQPLGTLMQRSVVYHQHVLTGTDYIPKKLRDGSVNSENGVMTRRFSMIMAREALAGRFDHVEPLPMHDGPIEGSIVVVLQRLVPQFKKSQGLTGAARKKMERFEDSLEPILGTVPKPLGGRNGKPLLFEFQYRSPALAFLMGTGIAPVALRSDADFVCNREEYKLATE